ncbi:Ig-like domain-containing protein [Octadecabacter ascidiaceicola]|uniref:Bifunctional hemolysin/adenylate cyclase n=1 Tax=Octadecabacter ascidiaceicola TaxID=1655543 RepID=A0A238KP83_9RHOB|nr:calcium-binding protein [Octadecabacter ascidiaceicola]SMX44548.1 Bifunctional hemolysin/adenylate cyclase precursor [Octadecabacter ascidiaceicola]
MSVQGLIDIGAIRFFHADQWSQNEGSSPAEWEIDQNAMDLSLIDWQERQIFRLNRLTASDTFVDLLGNFGPENALWIGYTRLPDIAEGDLYPGIDIRGIAIVSEEFSFGFVDQNGDVVELSIERLLAHEITHAALGTPDTTQPLDGSVPDPNYAGPTVDKENAIILEAFPDNESIRTTYSSVTPLSDLTERSNWTFGNEVDLVHVAKGSPPDDPTTTGPGFNINTSNNSTNLRDLIIYRDRDGDPVDNTIRSGDGSDYIYAGKGNDIISPGRGDDYAFAEDGNDVVLGFEGNDRLDGGENEDRSVDFDTLNYEALSYGIIVGVEEEATVNSPTVFYAEDSRENSQWRDLFWNFEKLALTRLDDTLKFDPKMFDLNIEGSGGFDSGLSLERGDLIDGSNLESDLTIALQGALSGDPGTIAANGFAVDVIKFDDVIATKYADTITGSDTSNKIYAGDEADSIDGGLGHDDIYGGLGNDTILGGDGADFIYDNGSASPIEDGEAPQEFLGRVLAYDTEGDDSIDGGAGADIIYYSGGIDTVSGGAGNDIYMTAPEVRGTSIFDDNLTIVLSETADDPFGNDLILGDGKGVDRVRFEGINRADVTVTYDYEKTFIGTQVVEFGSFFWYDFDLALTVDQYVTVGSVQITVNATGSSITVEQVTGFQFEGYYVGDTSPFEASMVVPFLVEFENGYLDWPTSMLDPATNKYTFTNSDHGEPENEEPPVGASSAGSGGTTGGGSSGGGGSNDPGSNDPGNGSNAFAALGSFEFERAQAETIIDGDDDDDDIYASTESEIVNAGGGNDRVFAGGGSDIVIGGAGADTLYGGSGTDTASYDTATSGVGVYLDEDRLTITNTFGDADGDVLEGFENLTGSDFDDRLYGDDGANLIVGRAGNDTIRGLGGQDTLVGGDGDDTIIASEYVDDDDVLFVSDVEMYGGAGNDTIRSSSGNDIIFGGDGDDLVELSNFTNIFAPGTPGNDTVNGGSGLDTVHFFNGPIIVDLGAGTAEYVGTGESVRLIDVEGIKAGGEDDLIIGGAGDNILDGGGGDDTLIGGAGDDELYGATYNFRDDAILYGGSGVDTAHVTWDFTNSTLEVIEGGLKINKASGSGSYTIYDDIEFIQFSDANKTYQELAQGLITEFAVIDDYIRVEEGATVTLDLLANDLEFDGNAITLETINGVAADPGANIRLSSGAVITVEADGSLTLDQGGAYAWLDANESVFTVLTYTATDSTNVVREATSTLVIDGVDTETNNIHLDRNVFITETNPDAAEALRIGNFDVSIAVLIIDEQYIDPNDVPVGFSVEEINGETFITYGGDDAVILSDVALDTWQYAAANRTVGTSADELINGTDGDDVIQAGAGNDTVRSGEGNDVVIGQDGVDRLSFTGGDNIAIGGAGGDFLTAFGGGENLLYGGEGDDQLFSNDGDDTLNGGSGNDSLLGRDGDDTLLGGDGDDVFFGGSGQDSFDGGAGFDQVVLYNDDVAGLSGGVTVDLAAGWISWSSIYPLETLVSIESVLGTGQDDTLLGDEFDNVLAGNSGDDLIHGRGGDDSLYTGSGSSTLYGDAGDDLLYDQSEGGDQLFGGDGDDRFNVNTLFGGANEFHGGDGSDTLDLSGSNQMLNVDLTSGQFEIGAESNQFSGIENIIGTNGDNILIGDGADNTFEGLGGADTYTLGNGNNLVRVATGSGHDIITDFDIAEDAIEINGANFDPSVGATGVTATQIGSDTVLNFGAQDSLTLNGIDLTSWQTASTGPTGDGTITGTVGNDIIDGTFADDPEGDVITDNGDTINAGAGADKIYDGAGDDVVFGGDGRDTFFAGAGADQYDGGAANNDAVNYSLASQGVTVDLTDGSNNSGIAAGDTYTNVEEITGSSLDDIIVGDASIFKLYGGAGNDVITSGTLKNILAGNAGADTFVFGVGSNEDVVKDFSVGEDILDVSGWGATSLADLTLDDSSGKVYVSFGSDSFRLDGIISVADLTDADFVFAQDTGSTGDGTITGTSGDDLIDGTFSGDPEGDAVTDDGQVINAGDGNDDIYDGAGDDTVFGGDGKDDFFAGDGADHYDGGASNQDVVHFTTSTVGLTVDLTDTSNSTGIATGDSYVGIERIIGSDFDDVLIGDGIVRHLYGGDGNDIIMDAAGSNYLRGGNGADTFVFGADGGNDRIYDFELGVDTIDVSAWGATSLDDLNIYENSGRLEVQLKSDLSERIQLDGLDQTHVDSFGASDFVFATGGGSGPTGNGTITGTSGNDIIDGNFAGDPEGDVITDNGDTIDAGVGNDKIYDGAGDDMVFGGDGTETFYAGAGADHYDGGASNHDGVDFSGATQGVTVDLTDGTGASNTGIAAGDTYINIEKIVGSSHDDTLIGDSLVNKLIGGDGDDTIVAGARHNIMIGGDGADTFVFATGSKTNAVKDFSASEGDLLDVSGWGATSLADLSLDDSSGKVVVSNGVDSITLDGIIAVSDLTDSDFAFV